MDAEIKQNLNDLFARQQALQTLMVSMLHLNPNKQEIISQFEKQYKLVLELYLDTPMPDVHIELLRASLADLMSACTGKIEKR